MADLRFQPQSREEALAQELAERLGDPEGLLLYLKVARRYSETCIRSILSRVLEYPRSVFREAGERSSTGSFGIMANALTTPILLRTLAIDPGTREMGYAVLEGTELLHFGVHTFPHRLSAQRLAQEGQRFVTALIETFAPHPFVIEETQYPRSKRSPRLHGFVRGLQHLAKRRRLMVLVYSPTMVKYTMVGDEAAPRRHVAETLVRQGYPYLAKYLATDQRTQEHYWENMFDAITLGLTAYEEVTKQTVLKTFRISFTP